MGNKRGAYLSKKKSLKRKTKRARLARVDIFNKSNDFSDYTSDCYISDENNENVVNNTFIENEKSSAIPKTSKDFSDDVLSELFIEVGEPRETFDFTGRRIVDIQYLFKSLQCIKHIGFDCTFCDVEINSEKRFGFRSVFTTKCKMCDKVDTISTEDPDKAQLVVTTAAVSGIVCTGGSYACLEEITSALNIPSISSRTFFKHQQKVYTTITALAWDEMIQAGKEEKELAIQTGEVDDNGVPIITVAADGAWSKRSYKSNYNALSGVGAIIGWRTKKILYVGIKNKYCRICQHDKKLQRKTEHDCFKNWQGSTTAMEAGVIVDGFKKSIQMHGLIYGKLIGDGDSSVMRKVRDAAPYGPQFVIQKIECKNHILRNLGNKIKEAAKKPKLSPIIKSHLLKSQLRFRYAVTKAVEYRKNQLIHTNDKIILLKSDILNSYKHIFGEHSKCADYFCNGSKEGEKNLYPEFTSSSIYEDVVSAVNRVVMHANSLIEDVDNNIVETFNSVVAKYVAGKRINYSQRGSYTTRCEAAVTSFNSKGELNYKLQKLLGTCSPGNYTKSYSEKKIRNLNYKRRVKWIKPKKLLYSVDEDGDYGENAGVADMENATYLQKEKQFLEQLKNEDPTEIQKLTVGQRNNILWKTMRLKRLTASNFGKVVKLKKTTSTANTVKCLLYQEFLGSLATQYGIENEDRAITQFQQITGFEVKSCGLFVDPQYPFLAASPDGLVGEDAIVEVKCPYNSRMSTPKEATENGVIKFLRIDDDGELQLKSNDNYMYQVQGQLNITNKNKCYFVVWTPKDCFFQIIYKDENFWESKISKLSNFYKNALLPELIDPRKVRGQELRKTYL